MHIIKLFTLRADNSRADVTVFRDDTAFSSASYVERAERKISQEPVTEVLGAEPKGVRMMSVERVSLSAKNYLLENESILVACLPSSIWHFQAVAKPCAVCVKTKSTTRCLQKNEKVYG